MTITAINTGEILLELQEFFRNSDILSITERGVTTTSDSFNGDNNNKIFTVTNTLLRNVRSVTVNSVLQRKYIDYTIEHDAEFGYTGRIVFVTAPPAGTNNVVIQYDYVAVGDRIFFDYPQLDIKLDKYPRVGFDIISAPPIELALGGECNQTNITFSLTAYGNKAEIETIINKVRESLINNKKNFFYLRFVTIGDTSPLIVPPEKYGKIYTRSIDFSAPFEFEL